MLCRLDKRPKAPWWPPQPAPPRRRHPRRRDEPRPRWWRVTATGSADGSAQRPVAPVVAPDGWEGPIAFVAAVQDTIAPLSKIGVFRCQGRAPDWSPDDRFIMCSSRAADAWMATTRSSSRPPWAARPSRPPTAGSTRITGVVTGREAVPLLLCVRQSHRGQVCGRWLPRDRNRSRARADPRALAPRCEPDVALRSRRRPASRARSPRAGIAPPGPCVVMVASQTVPDHRGCNDPMRGGVQG